MESASESYTRQTGKPQGAKWKKENIIGQTTYSTLSRSYWVYTLLFILMKEQKLIRIEMKAWH